MKSCVPRIRLFQYNIHTVTPLRFFKAKKKGFLTCGDQNLTLTFIARLLNKTDHN